VRCIGGAAQALAGPGNILEAVQHASFADDLDSLCRRLIGQAAKSSSSRWATSGAYLTSALPITCASLS